MFKRIMMRTVLGGAAALGLLESARATTMTNGVPQSQGVYGGRVGLIDAVPLSNSTTRTRLFIATESANSAFYTDVDATSTNPFATNFSFSVVPDFDNRANYGTLNGIAGHGPSAKLFVADELGLFSCAMTAGTRVTNVVGSGGGGSTNPSFSSVLIQGSVLLAIGSQGGSNWLYYGALDTNGVLTLGSASPLNLGIPSTISALDLAISPSNNCVHVVDLDGTNGFWKSSDAYTALGAGTTFAAQTAPTNIASWTSGKKRLGFGPEGRVFLAGATSTNKVVAYQAATGGSWTVVNTGLGGTSGGNLETSDNPANYWVYFGGIVSTNMGADGSWKSLGWVSAQTHPNDGEVMADPLNNALIYLTTDQGIGASTNGGMDLREIDRGVEAVQIEDFDMTAAKTVAWTASKSGIRRGTNYPTAPVWSDALFPNNDGSPYYAIGIDASDTNGHTAVAGNGQLYRTTDGGTNWSGLYNNQSNTNGFSSSGGYFTALEVYGKQMFAGYYNPDSTRAGVLYSTNTGANWMQPLRDVDINDILFDTTGGVAYVAAAYDAATGTGGVFEITTAGAVTYTLTNAVGIRDLVRDAAGGIFACGQERGSNGVAVYYKSATATTWKAMTTNGLPAQTGVSGARGPVMCVGKDIATNDLPIMAVGRQLYYLRDSYNGTNWETESALAYPNGTQINVLYWDALLVGTEAGLYSQYIGVGPSAAKQDGYETNAVADDFDGDGKDDFALYQESSGNWYLKPSSYGYTTVSFPTGFGGPDQAPLAGDFDGDRRADFVVYNETNGYWSFLLSASSYGAFTYLFGGTNFDALAGDFDGDGLCDLGSYNFTSGDWWLKPSSYGYQTVAFPTGFGGTNYDALAGDFDDDGEDDFALFETTSGNWYLKLSAYNYTLYSFPYNPYGQGAEPIVGDWDGDGADDFGYYTGGHTGMAYSHFHVRLSAYGYADYYLSFDVP